MLIIGIPAAAAAQEADDLKKLQGTWIVVSANTGDPQRDASAIGAMMKFADNTMQSFDAKGEQETGMREIALNAKETPKHIDVIRGKNRIIRGIYELEKSRLTICFSRNSDTERPKDFVTFGGPKDFGVLVLERKK